MSRIILIFMLAFSFIGTISAQEENEMDFDFNVDGNNLVFTTEIDPIHSYEEKYTIDLSYRIIFQDRSTLNRSAINRYTTVIFQLNDLPEVSAGKSSFSVDINKYLSELLNSEVNTISFRVKANLSFMPVNLDMKDKFKSKKPLTGSLDGYNKYVELDPLIRYSYSISSNNSSNLSSGDLENRTYSFTTGPLQKLDPGEYTFSVKSSKYGNDSDSKVIMVKKSSPAVFIILGAIGGGVVYVLTSGGGKGNKGLPPLPDPPDPN